MASSAVLALLLVFRSASANDFNDLLSPLLSPIFGSFLRFPWLFFVGFLEVFRFFFGVVY